MSARCWRRIGADAGRIEGRESDPEARLTNTAGYHVIVRCPKSLFFVAPAVVLLTAWSPCVAQVSAEPGAARESRQSVGADVDVPVPEGIRDGDPLVAEAVEAAVEEVRASPSDAEAWDSLASLYLAHSLLPETIACYERLAELGDLTAKQLYRKAFAHHELGEQERAVEIAARASEAAPEAAPLLWHPGFWLLELGRVEEAEALFRRAIEVAPGSEAAWAGIARIHLQRREGGEAEEVIRHRLLGGANELYGRQLLASALRMQGRGREAAEQVAIAGGAGPRWDDPWLRDLADLRTGYNAEKRRADGMIVRREYAQAEAIFRELIERWPDDPNLLNNLAVIKYRTGQVPAALDLWRRCLEIDPEDSRAHLNLGMNLAHLAVSRRGDPQEALHHLDRAAEINPVSARAWESRGSLLLAMQRFEDAERSYKRVLEIDPDHVGAIGGLGQVEMRRLRPEVAAEYFERVTKIAPRDARGHVALARALIDSGDLDGAQRSIAEASTLMPPNHMQLQMLRQMLQRRRAQGGGG